MDTVQLKTRIKEKLWKMAQATSELSDFGSNVTGGIKSIISPIQHANSQLSPAPGQVTDVQKIKNFMNSQALKEYGEGMRGMGKTALGLGMTLPATALASYHYGPEALGAAWNTTRDNPKAVAAGLGGLTGAAVGHKLTGGSVGSLLGSLGGAYLGSNAVS